MKSVEITQSWFTEEKLPTVEVTPLWTAIKTMPLFIRKRAKKVKFRKKYVETFFISKDLLKISTTITSMITMKIVFFKKPKTSSLKDGLIHCSYSVKDQSMYFDVRESETHQQLIDSD